MIVLRQSKDCLGPFWEARIEPEPERGPLALRRYEVTPDTPYRPDFEPFCGRSLPSGWCGFHLEALREEELPLWESLLDPEKQATPGETEYNRTLAAARSALRATDWDSLDEDAIILLNDLRKFY